MFFRGACSLVSKCKHRVALGVTWVALGVTWVALGCVYNVTTDRFQKGDNTKTSTNENQAVDYTIPIVDPPSQYNINEAIKNILSVSMMAYRRTLSVE